MDWDFAIERWRVPLLGIVADLFAEIGLSEDGATAGRVSKSLYTVVLGRLRKAESAVRRLIYVAARNIVLEPPAKRPVQATPEIAVKDKTKAEGDGKAEATVIKQGQRRRRPSFNLFDPRKRFGKGYRRPARRQRPEPRIQILDIGPDPRIPLYLVYRQAPPPVPVAEDEADDDTVDATKPIRRLLAIMDALQDIPRQAMRLALWRSRPIEERRPERWSPLRPGKPPGYRERPKHEVDVILKECDWLARNVQPPLDDTS